MNPISPLRPTLPPTPTPILPPRGCFKQERKGQMAAGRGAAESGPGSGAAPPVGVWDVQHLPCPRGLVGGCWLLALELMLPVIKGLPPYLPPSGSLAFFFPPASLRAKHPASGQDAASWQGWAFLFSSPHPGACQAWAPLIQAGAKLPHRLPGRIPPSLFPEGTVTLSH